MSGDARLQLAGIARRMRAVALEQDDKFQYMVGLLIEHAQALANEDRADPQLIDIARSVARAWMQIDHEKVG